MDTMSPIENIPSVKFKGSSIDCVNYADICTIIRDGVQGRGYIVLTNVLGITKGTRDRELLEATNGALLSVIDGMPLKWFARLSGFERAERVSGPALFRSLLEGKNDFRHFLLGDTHVTIEKVISKAKRANPNVRVSGYSPPFKDVFDTNDTSEILRNIARDDPDIIWVSFGGLKQAKWMSQTFHLLDRGIMIGVGAAFRFYIGDIQEPHVIFQRLGLQWLFRLVEDPKRWAPQMLKGFPYFLSQFPFEVIKARRCNSYPSKHTQRPRRREASER
jgi:N-acetylglucosaminyldiphosphoundecaprenol N-acetyl-beta-D-mannosaminyltransferase